MKDRIIQLVAFLKSKTEFTSVVGEKLFPLVADEGTEGAFVLYTISSVPLSKDGGREYNAALRLFFPRGKFTEMVGFADVCTDLLQAHPNYDVGPVDPDYSDDYKSLFMTIPFNID